MVMILVTLLAKDVLNWGGSSSGAKSRAGFVLTHYSSSSVLVYPYLYGDWVAHRSNRYLKVAYLLT